MKTEVIKLELIDRLIKIQEISTLKKLEKLVTQAELESRSIDSVKAINKGDTITLDKFKNIAVSLSGKLVTPDVKGEIPDLRYASSGMTSDDQVHIRTSFLRMQESH